MNQNNSHLIAGFFRYHREKLNYSLRGLVGDGKVVDLSSLSAFEQGKKILNDNQLVWLFNTIGFDYHTVINTYSFSEEYDNIINLLCLGETKYAFHIFDTCLTKGVFKSLGAVNFFILNDIFQLINNKCPQYLDICVKLERLMHNEQRCILKIALSILKMNDGLFNEMLYLLNEANELTYNTKIKAWITFERGRCFGLTGNYTESIVSLLEAKQRYSEFLGIIRMIQTELNLGSVYTLTNTYIKAEESYMSAYRSALLLDESSYLLTKCFNSLCWLYFNQNEYDKVKILLEDKPDELVESRNTYFILAWAYYKIGNYEEAIKYCEEGLKKFRDYSYVCMIYEYIENVCKGVKSGQDALLRKIIETEDYDNDAFTNKLFTYEIIDIYERRKNYEKAFKYAKKLLNR